MSSRPSTPRTRAPTSRPPTELFRVFPYLAGAKTDEPGGALFVRQPQGTGRVDLPGLRVLYLSSSPAGAIAEVFAPLAVWEPRMFTSPTLPQAPRSLGRYELAADAKILDLDDPEALRALGLRPSEVVTPDRAVTQRWAKRVVDERRWDGVRWWSFYDARWYSYGLWERRHLTLLGVEPLSLGHAAVVEAARLLRRPRTPS